MDKEPEEREAALAKDEDGLREVMRGGRTNKEATRTISGIKPSNTMTR